MDKQFGPGIGTVFPSTRDGEYPVRSRRYQDMNSNGTMIAVMILGTEKRGCCRCCRWDRAFALCLRLQVPRSGIAPWNRALPTACFGEYPGVGCCLVAAGIGRSPLLASASTQVWSCPGRLGLLYACSGVYPGVVLVVW